MTTTIHVVGGVYHEQCARPRWNEIYGSAGRAALAIATLSAPTVLHTYANPDAAYLIRTKAIGLSAFQLESTPVEELIRFDYLHAMATPSVYGKPSTPHADLCVEHDRVVRFGMLEGDAIVHAEWAVYDPQNGGDVRPFDANGSSARHLAVVLNAFEASQMAELTGHPPEETAPRVAARYRAEVVVVKMGTAGALVWTSSGSTHVPAFCTPRVWKIGSGDCFVGAFAYAWMYEGRTPVEAARFASRATAHYCNTRRLPTQAEVAAVAFPSAPMPAQNPGPGRQVYLAGPFFDVAQLGLVQTMRQHLWSVGLRVFSPYHDVGSGNVATFVHRDLQGIRDADLVLALVDGLDPGTIFEIGYARALNKPVVVYTERHDGESLTMMEGSECTICRDYASAVYTAAWKANAV